MSMLPQRLRAILTTAVLWAGASMLACGPVLTIVWLIRGRSRDLLEVLRLGLVLWGGFGAMNGIAFGVFLMLAERNRTLEQLSRTRVALWGGIGAALFPAVLFLLIVAIPGFTLLGPGAAHAGIREFLTSCLINGILGAAVATTHLSLARRLPGGNSPQQLTDRAAT
jgi:hypothetical protein